MHLTSISAATPFSCTHHHPQQVESSVKAEAEPPLPKNRLHAAFCKQLELPNDTCLVTDKIKKIAFPNLNALEERALVEFLTRKITITGGKGELKVKTSYAELFTYILQHAHQHGAPIKDFYIVGSAVSRHLPHYLENLLELWGSSTPKELMEGMYTRHKNWELHDIDFYFDASAVESHEKLCVPTSLVIQFLHEKSGLGIGTIKSRCLRDLFASQWKDADPLKITLVGLSQENGPDIDIKFTKSHDGEGFFHLDGGKIPLRGLLEAWNAHKSSGGTLDTFHYGKVLPYSDVSDPHQAALDEVLGIIRPKTPKSRTSKGYARYICKRVKKQTALQENPFINVLLETHKEVKKDLLYRACSSFSKTPKEAAVAFWLQMLTDLPRENSLAASLVNGLDFAKVDELLEKTKQPPVKEVSPFSHALYTWLKTFPDDPLLLLDYLRIKTLHSLFQEGNDLAEFDGDNIWLHVDGFCIQIEPPDTACFERLAQASTLPFALIDPHLRKSAWKNPQTPPTLPAIDPLNYVEHPHETIRELAFSHYLASTLQDEKIHQDRLLFDQIKTRLSKYPNHPFLKEDLVYARSLAKEPQLAVSIERLQILTGETEEQIKERIRTELFKKNVNITWLLALLKKLPLEKAYPLQNDLFRLIKELLLKGQKTEAEKLCTELNTSKILPSDSLFYAKSLLLFTHSLAKAKDISEHVLLMAYIELKALPSWEKIKTEEEAVELHKLIAKKLKNPLLTDLLACYPIQEWDDAQLDRLIEDDFFYSLNEKDRLFVLDNLIKRNLFTEACRLTINTPATQTPYFEKLTPYHYRLEPAQHLLLLEKALFFSKEDHTQGFIEAIFKSGSLLEKQAAWKLCKLAALDGKLSLKALQNCFLICCKVEKSCAADLNNFFLSLPNDRLKLLADCEWFSSLVPGVLTADASLNFMLLERMLKIPECGDSAEKLAEELIKKHLQSKPPNIVAAFNTLKDLLSHYDKSTISASITQNFTLIARAILGEPTNNTFAYYLAQLRTLFFTKKHASANCLHFLSTIAKYSNSYCKTAAEQMYDFRKQFDCRNSGKAFAGMMVQLGKYDLENLLDSYLHDNAIVKSLSKTDYATVYIPKFNKIHMQENPALKNHEAVLSEAKKLLPGFPFVSTKQQLQFLAIYSGALGKRFVDDQKPENVLCDFRYFLQELKTMKLSKQEREELTIAFSGILLNALLVVPDNFLYDTPPFQQLQKLIAELLHHLNNEAGDLHLGTFFKSALEGRIQLALIANCTDLLERAFKNAMNRNLLIEEKERVKIALLLLIDIPQTFKHIPSDDLVLEASDEILAFLKNKNSNYCLEHILYCFFSLQSFLIYYPNKLLNWFKSLWDAAWLAPNRCLKNLPIFVLVLQHLSKQVDEIKKSEGQVPEEIENLIQQFTAHVRKSYADFHRKSNSQKNLIRSEKELLKENVLKKMELGVLLLLEKLGVFPLGENEQPNEELVHQLVIAYKNCSTFHIIPDDRAVYKDLSTSLATFPKQYLPVISKKLLLEIRSIKERAIRDREDIEKTPTEILARELYLVEELRWKSHERELLLALKENHPEQLDDTDLAILKSQSLI